MDVLSIVLAIVLICLVALFFHLRRFRGILETTGLPMLKPFLCFGSPPFLFNKIRIHEWYQEKFQQLGYTFCRYDGVSPSIATIDPEIIKEVCTKQFDNFHAVFDWDFTPGQTTLDLAKYIRTYVVLFHDINTYLPHLS